jgi:hypothetical protein
MRRQLIFTAIVFLLFSCNKDKYHSKKLMRGQVWAVESLTVDGSNYGVLGEWTITRDVDIYNTVPSAVWEVGLETTDFNWQFRDRGKTFELSVSEECSVSPIESLDFQTYFVSGNYELVKCKNKYMEFNSRNTVGFPNQLVKISIRRN